MNPMGKSYNPKCEVKQKSKSVIQQRIWAKEQRQYIAVNELKPSPLNIV